MNRANQFASSPAEPARLRVVGGHGGSAVKFQEDQRLLVDGEDRFRGMCLVERREAEVETGNVCTLPVEPVSRSNGPSSYEQARRIVEQIHREIEQQAERERKDRVAVAPVAKAMKAAAQKPMARAGWRQRLRLGGSSKSRFLRFAAE